MLSEQVPYVLKVLNNDIHLLFYYYGLISFYPCYIDDFRNFFTQLIYFNFFFKIIHFFRLIHKLPHFEDVTSDELVHAL